MAGFLTPLRVELIEGTLGMRQVWRLLEPVEYCLKEPDAPERVIVPTGFITDFASVPRVFWTIFPPTGPYAKAAVVHDYLYQTRRLSLVTPHGTGIYLVDRKQADGIFMEAMGVLGVPLRVKWPVYLGVRVGGQRVWARFRDEESLQPPETL